ncbi:MAG TPA: AI-2E family transporter [Oligoflexia bacterium]|nr:AI-2E family transporter [Oligoflexia bacterium]HMP48880.1 AI-2E family transporter [Oligoflexia bacterium]
MEDDLELKIQNASGPESVVESENDTSSPGGSKNPVVFEKSELQKTLEYLGVLRDEYRAEIRIFILLFIFYLFYSLVREITTLVLASYLIALLLDPLLLKFEKWGFSRSTGMLIIFGALIVFISVVLWILIPPLAFQTRELILNFPGYVEGSFQKTKAFVESVFNFSVPATAGEVREYVSSLIEGRPYESLKPMLQQLGKTLFAGYSLTLSLINLALLPFIVFYLSRDWKILHGQLKRGIPSTYRGRVIPFLKDVQGVLVGYARGQFVVSLVLMFAYSSALFLLGVRFALPLGVFAGILSVVPYLGFFSGLVLALCVQIVQDGSMWGIMQLILSFLFIQTIESNFITPRVVGESTGLHPLAVILALVMGGTIFGFVGLILGIPLAAILKIVFVRVLKPL